MTATCMESEISVAPVARNWARTGRWLSGLAIAFLVFDSVSKFLRPPGLVEACARLGVAENLINPIAIILLICTALYALPRTAFLGAILLTGYLGGAVMSHLRVGDPIASHVLFPTYIGALLWSGLFLRDSRLRALFPLRSVSCN